jgi:hypothetical protein
MGGRYSSGAPNLNVYLKGHAGDLLVIDRKGRKSERIECPALTLGLTVQPAVLRGLARSPDFRGKGLLARFLYSLPLSLVGRRDPSPPPVPTEVRAAYATNLTTLLNLTPDTAADGAPDPRVLTLTEEAQALVAQLSARLEPELAEFGRLGGIQDWGAKLLGATLRIAGLFHLAEHTGNETPWEAPVGRSTVERAWAIGEYLIPHALAAFAEMGADPAVEDARYLLRWLARHVETGGQTSFTRREAHQGTKGRFKRVEALDAPLALLAAHGYVRRRAAPPPQGPGKPPSPTYDVNPLWANSGDCGNCGKG